MAHEVETMAYATAVGTPWHGLGTEIPDGSTVEDMEKAAGLDWRVDRRKIFMNTDRNGDTKIQVPDFYAVTRDKDSKVYQVCGPDYRTVQNKDILRFFKDYCDAGEMSIQTAGSLRDGAVVWAMARVNHGSDFDLGHGDKVKSYVVLATSHDGSLLYQGFDTSVCVVCMNTLRMSLEGERNILFRMKHSASAATRQSREAQAKETLNKAIKRNRELYEKAHMLVETPMNQRMARRFVAELTDTGKLEANQDMSGDIRVRIDDSSWVPDEEINRVAKGILDSVYNSPGSNLPTRNGTAWGVLNGVTHYVDHVAGRNTDTRLQAAWFGPRADLKSKALEMAVEYAELARG